MLKQDNSDKLRLLVGMLGLANKLGTVETVHLYGELITVAGRRGDGKTYALSLMLGGEMPHGRAADVCQGCH